MFGVERVYCIGCGLTKPKYLMNMVMGTLGLCRECMSMVQTTKDMTFSGKEFTDLVISPFLYSGVISDTVRQFKFSGQKKYGDFLTAAALECFENKNLFSGCDLIVPVPLHPNRLRERGYNQSDIIAKRMGKTLGIAVDTVSLIRIRDTLHQSSLKGLQRIENVKNAFFANEGGVLGKNVILVDDIYTMGETANECARALKNAGAKKVVVFTLCKTINKSSLI